MTFEEVEKYLEQLGETRMRLDLKPMEELLTLFGNVDRGLSSVLVAGTNGKGSVCAYLTSIAKSSNLRVGTFTSPHLESVTERICIQGQPLEPEKFSKIATQIAHVLEQTEFDTITYFEFLTILAVLAFVEEKVDIAIFEIGLGGRLDATNALVAIATTITSIDFDHVGILGSTIKEIAGEKAGIFRKNVPAIVSEQPHNEAREQLQMVAKKIGAPLSFASTLRQFGNVTLGLRGRHQIHNAEVAATTACILREKGFDISDSAITRGLSKATLPGRLERFILDGKEIWLDVAHNPAAAEHLMQYLKAETLAPVSIVLGMAQDKDWKRVIEILTEVAESFTLCKPASPRAWRTEEVEKVIPPHLLKKTIENPALALQAALMRSSRVLCTGSFYTVGPVRAWLTTTQ